jgi:hypothetical protein
MPPFMTQPLISLNASQVFVIRSPMDPGSRKSQKRQATNSGL